MMIKENEINEGLKIGERIKKFENLVQCDNDIWGDGLRWQKL